ncbi:MAG: zinc ribbon domain-containing protein [Myxococcota bacterium]
MPIYEYECTACGHRFELMQKIGAEPPPCPDCAAVEVRKRISQSAFILKGGGWYKDHYGLKGGGSGDSASKSDGGSKADGAKADSGSKADAPKSDGGAAKADAPKSESKSTTSTTSTTTTTAAK